MLSFKLSGDSCLVENNTFIQFLSPLFKICIIFSEKYHFKCFILFNIYFVTSFNKSVYFLVTCRDEIAGCSEKAYDYLSINDARHMLLFSSDQELFEYIKEVNILLLQ